MRFCFGLIHFGLVLAAALTWAAEASEEWFLLSREEGCVGLELLARMERLDRAPRDPEDFATLMRARGHRVSVGLPDGFPMDFTGRAVMVRYRDNRAPVFLRAELCGNLRK